MREGQRGHAPPPHPCHFPQLALGCMMKKGTCSSVAFCDQWCAVEGGQFGHTQEGLACRTQTPVNKVKRLVIGNMDYTMLDDVIKVVFISMS